MNSYQCLVDLEIAWCFLFSILLHYVVKYIDPIQYILFTQILVWLGYVFILSLSACGLHLLINGGTTWIYGTDRLHPPSPVSSTFLESLTLEVDVRIQVLCLLVCCLIHTADILWMTKFNVNKTLKESSDE